MNTHIRRYTALSAGFFMITAAPFSMAQQKDLSTPSCPAYFQFNPANGKCDPETAKIQALPAEKCKNTAGISYDINGKQCKVIGTPSPMCAQIAGGSLVLKENKCLFEVKTPTSGRGDYVGDYFTIKAVPSDNPDLLGGSVGDKLKVLSQTTLPDNDRQLLVVRIAHTGTNPILTDSSTEAVGSAVQVKASDLITYGASRTGWAYGVLAVPYKYYTGSKNFNSGMSVGPYVGRRWGRAGSAYTLAASAAIGSVKGEERDAANKIVSTPDLMAYSVAAGIMWEIAKAQDATPFRVGFFGGTDMVSNDDKVKFKNNRKLWIAFQIGYDFTDN